MQKRSEWRLMRKSSQVRGILWIKVFRWGWENPKLSKWEIPTIAYNTNLMFNDWSHLDVDIMIN